MHVTRSVCPIHSSGGDGHDNSLPLCTFIPSVNHVLNTVVDKCDSEGRNGPAEIYVCGALKEIAGRNVLIKQQAPSILSASLKSPSCTKLDSFLNTRQGLYSP